MDSERELRCLAAVWALRGILTPEGFKDFKLQDGLVFWDKEDLEELLDYLKAKETAATVQLLSTNSRTTLEKGMEAVTLTREVTLVNEFLGQLERFGGTFVGATNLREILDLAVFRRFDFKVGFDYLRQDQAWLLFRAMVGDLKVPIHPSEAGQLKARLAQLHHLTPGDFAVIQRKSLMLEKRPTGELLLIWLEQEVSSKPGLRKALVGF